MSLSLFVSNQLEPLSEKLAILLKGQQLDVFGMHYIITQTEGMNAWLKIRNAELMGISANTIFLKPNELISKLYIWSGGDYQALVDADVIRWDIFHRLANPSFLQLFPEISKYYIDSDLKRMSLATQLSDLFDQYPVYRPEMIGIWKDSGIPVSGSDEWQQYLWKELNPSGQSLHKDKVDVVNHIMEHFDHADFQDFLKNKMPVLSFFGVEVFTPFYLQLFQKLSKIIDIDFYMLNPAPYCYWTEDKSEKQIAWMTMKSRYKEDQLHLSRGNSLLSSWGGLFKETYSMLFGIDEFVNSYDESLSIAPVHPSSLLQKIQYDIFNNNLDDERVAMSQEDLKDGSIVINSCFTPVREVEVLYNYLVSLVDKKKEDLSPRDIVVMVSDIDQYAPYIRAVFDHAPYRFPFTIADESITMGNNLFAAIELFLGLDSVKFKVEQVMELLDSPLVRKRLNIKNLDVIRKAVKAANIRFGIQGDTQDDTRFLSWEYGIKRILYGLCISGGQIYQDEQEFFYPIDAFEGNETGELVKFIYYLDLIKQAMKERSSLKSLPDWVRWLQQNVENCIFQSGISEDEDYHRFIHYTEKMMVEEREFSELPISFEVFRFGFMDLLQHDRRSHTFAGTGITFASLIPMRSIPFKVVAMLGMDYNKFPRKEVKLSFNLIDQEKQKGDRSVRENDKHLFLETLLSAKKYFYISYIGYHVKDGSVLPPSSLVDELLNYIEKGVSVKKDKIITPHPLHGFSQQYFIKDGLLNYLEEKSDFDEETGGSTAREDLDFDYSVVQFLDLEKFWKDPVKWFFNKNLRIHYSDESWLLPESELFDIDTLIEWKLKNELLAMNTNEAIDYLSKEKMQGRLPLKNVAVLVLERIQELIVPVKEEFDSIRNNAAPVQLPVSLSIGATRITGKLKDIYGNKQVHVIFSSNAQKHILVPYLNFLIAKAAGYEIDIVVMHVKEKYQHTLTSGSISIQEAQTKIEYLVECMIKGTTDFYLFHPEIPLKELKGDYSKFRKFIDTEIGKEDFSKFKDPYLLKAEANGFFSESNYKEFQRNMNRIFDDVKFYFPNLFKN